MCSSPAWGPEEEHPHRLSSELRFCRRGLRAKDPTMKERPQQRDRRANRSRSSNPTGHKNNEILSSGNSGVLADGDDRPWIIRFHGVHSPTEQPTDLVRIVESQVPTRMPWRYACRTNASPPPLRASASGRRNMRPLSRTWEIEPRHSAWKHRHFGGSKGS